MGVGNENLTKKTAELARIKGYRSQFKRVFPKEGMTPDTIAKAVAAYERTLVCKDTAYDRYAQGEDGALTDQQKEGWALFMGKGQCVVCHAPPLFSSAMGTPGGLYYNVGIGTAGKAEEEVDVGRFAVSAQEADWAAFKVPSLRNVSKSAPYFHDGSVATLAEAVKIMATGGIDNKNKTALLADRGLSDDEIAALVAFLAALDCGGKLEEPKLP
jgi:cytochrome c peroxidase